MQPEFLQLIQIPLQIHLFKHHPGLFEVIPGLDAIQFLVVALGLQQAFAYLVIGPGELLAVVQALPLCNGLRKSGSETIF